MLIEVKLPQLSNAEPPICVTELGIVIEVKLPHPSNAEPPICVTELGMVKIEAILLKYEIITFLPFVYNAFSSVSNNELLHSILRTPL